MKGFLGVLLPLITQIGLKSIVTYLNRVLTEADRASALYSGFSLFGTFLSIFASCALIFFLSRYLIYLLPVAEREKTIGRRIILLITFLFLFACLYSVFYISKGDWAPALNLALGELFSWTGLLLWWCC